MTFVKFNFFFELLRLIQRVNGEKISRPNASHYYSQNGLTSPKYLRKFAFDKMIQLDIPESVADFIQGRVPKRIGAKHYMALARQADQKYGRYAEYHYKVEAETPQLTPSFLRRRISIVSCARSWHMFRRFLAQSLLLSSQHMVRANMKGS